jgi:hypothetical protein
MPLIYCDHNFIVTSSQEPTAYANHLRRLGETEAVAFVLSPVHWIDAAEDANEARSIATSDFMDSLRPRWMYYRLTVERKEVADAFFRFARIPADAPQMIVEISDVIADLSGERAHRDSRAFITHLRNVGPDHPLRQTLRQALVTNQKNTEQFHAGKLTLAMAQKVEKLYVKKLLPPATPSGVLIDASSKEQFLNRCQLTDFPSIALENKATQDHWQQRRQLNQNNFIDQQHLIALPYVDFFITDDGGLRNLIGRITANLPFRIATLLTKAEFEVRYPA